MRHLKITPLGWMFASLLVAMLACQSSNTAPVSTQTPKPTDIPNLSIDAGLPKTGVVISLDNTHKIAPLTVWKQNDYVQSIAWTISSTNQEWLVVVTDDANLYAVNDLSNPVEVSRRTPDIISFSWDGEQLLYMDDSAASVYVWKIAEQDGLGAWGKLNADEDRFWDMCLLADNNSIVTTSYDDTGLDIWRLDGGRHQREILRPEWEGSQIVNYVECSSAGHLALSARKHSTVEIWHIEGDEFVHLSSFSDLGEYIDGIVFSPDARFLAVNIRDKGIAVYDIASQTQIGLLENDARPRKVSFSPNGNILAAIYEKGQIILWNANTGERLQELYDKNIGNNILFSPDGTLLVTSGGKAQITFWGVLE